MDSRRPRIDNCTRGPCSQSLAPRGIIHPSASPSILAPHHIRTSRIATPLCLRNPLTHLTSAQLTSILTSILTSATPPPQYASHLQPHSAASRSAASRSATLPLSSLALTSLTHSPGRTNDASTEPLTSAQVPPTAEVVLPPTSPGRARIAPMAMASLVRPPTRGHIHHPPIGLADVIRCLRNEPFVSWDDTTNVVAEAVGSARRLGLIPAAGWLAAPLVGVGVGGTVAMAALVRVMVIDVHGAPITLADVIGGLGNKPLVSRYNASHCPAVALDGLGRCRLVPRRTERLGGRACAVVCLPGVLGGAAVIVVPISDDRGHRADMWGGCGVEARCR
mmetsp:Transcript_16939/g.34232  ORF Transcript_16939/g.34232 Transcript_16939/m.34232 type:complete len:335 (-) Transcript_16939:1142-2146(-)